MVETTQIITQQDFNNTLDQLVEVLEKISTNKTSINSNSDLNINIVKLCGQIRNALRVSNDSKLSQSQAIQTLLEKVELLNFYYAAKKYFPRDENHIIHLFITLLLDDEINAHIYDNLARFMDFAAIDLSDFKNVLFTAIKMTTNSENYNGERIFLNGAYPSNNNNHHFQTLLHRFLQLKTEVTRLEDRELDVVNQWGNHLTTIIQNELNNNLAPWYALANDELLSKEFLIPAIQNMSAENQKHLITRMLNKIKDIHDPTCASAEKRKLLSANKYVEYALKISEIIANSPANQENEINSQTLMQESIDNLFLTNAQFEQNLALINHFYQHDNLKKYIVNAIIRLTPERRLQLNSHFYYLTQHSRLNKNDENNMVLNGNAAHIELAKLHHEIKIAAQLDLAEQLPSLFINIENNLDILAGFRMDANLTTLFTTFFSTQEMVDLQQQQLDEKENTIKDRRKKLKATKKTLEIESNANQENSLPLDELKNKFIFEQSELDTDIKDLNIQLDRFDNFGYQKSERLSDKDKCTLIKKIGEIAITLTGTFSTYPTVADLSRRLQIDALYHIVKLMNKTAEDNSETKQASAALLNSFAQLGSQFGELPEYPNSSLPSMDNKLLSAGQLDAIKAKLTAGGIAFEEKISLLLQIAQSKLTKINTDLLNDIKSQSTFNDLNQVINTFDKSIIEKINTEKSTKKELEQQIEMLTTVQNELTEAIAKCDAVKGTVTNEYKSALQNLMLYFNSFTIMSEKALNHYQNEIEMLSKKFSQYIEQIEERREQYHELLNKNAPQLIQLQQMNKDWEFESIKQPLAAEADSRHNDFSNKIAYIVEQEQHIKHLADIYTVDIKDEARKHHENVNYIDALLAFAQLGNILADQSHEVNAAKQSVGENIKELKQQAENINNLVFKLNGQPESAKEIIGNIAKTATKTWVPTIVQAVDTAISNQTYSNDTLSRLLAEVEKDKLDACYNSISKISLEIERSEQDANKAARQSNENALPVNSVDSAYVTLFTQRQAYYSLYEEINVYSSTLEREKQRVIRDAYNRQTALIKAIDDKIALIEQTQKSKHEINTVVLDEAQSLETQINTSVLEISNRIVGIFTRIDQTNLHDDALDENTQLELISKTSSEALNELSFDLVSKQRRLSKAPYDSTINTLNTLKEELIMALPKISDDKLLSNIKLAEINEFNTTYTAINKSLERTDAVLVEDVKSTENIIANNIETVKQQFNTVSRNASQQINDIETTLFNRSMKQEQQTKRNLKVGLFAWEIAGIALCTAIGFVVGGGLIGALVGFLSSTGAAAFGGGVGCIMNKASSRKKQSESADAMASRSSSSEPILVVRRNSQDTIAQRKSVFHENGNAAHAQAAQALAGEYTPAKRSVEKDKPYSTKQLFGASGAMLMMGEKGKQVNPPKTENSLIISANSSIVI